MTDLAAERRRLDQLERTQRQFLAATGLRDPTAERLRGSLFAYLGPRLAADAAMPDLNDLSQGVDAQNLRQHRRAIGDRIRHHMHGRLGRDADLSDLDSLLDALCEEEEGAQDGRRRARDEESVSRPGFEPTDTDPSENPFEAEDAELEELRSQMSPEAYDRLRRRASDRRRRGRDAEPSPFETFDRKRTARDQPVFSGAPVPGGGQDPMNEANVARPGFGEPRDIAAKDKRPGFRRFGQDSAGPRDFNSRFRFTGNATVGRPSFPAIKMTAT